METNFEFYYPWLNSCDFFNNEFKTEEFVKTVCNSYSEGNWLLGSFSFVTLA